MDMGDPNSKIRSRQKKQTATNGRGTRRGAKLDVLPITVLTMDIIHTLIPLHFFGRYE